MEHVPDLLTVEDEDALEQDHICGVDHSGLREPVGWARGGACLQCQTLGTDEGGCTGNQWGTAPGRGGVSSPAPCTQPSPPQNHPLTLSGSQNHR